MQDDDLWVKSSSGDLLTLQVKTTYKPRSDRSRPLNYAFTRA